MVCKMCGKKVVTTMVYRHEDEPSFTTYAAAPAAGAAAQTLTYDIHAIEPVPGPDGT